MNINKLLLGAAAGIIIVKILPKTKSYLKPAAITFLSKAVTMKDEAIDCLSSINEEALENRNKNNKSKEDLT
ncbi:MAG: hypothetical protein ABF633_14340 [Clostridium sp.]|uniref:hypothetical protein n=1 Tax=Clostridium sp. TaxID=1506 RepID=UPI0039E8E77C